MESVVVVFYGRRKPECPEKNISLKREKTNINLNSSHARSLALSLLILCYPCSQTRAVCFMNTVVSFL